MLAPLFRAQTQFTNQNTISYAHSRAARRARCACIENFSVPYVLNNFFSSSSLRLDESTPKLVELISLKQRMCFDSSDDASKLAYKHAKNFVRDSPRGNEVVVSRESKYDGSSSTSPDEQSRSSWAVSRTRVFGPRPWQPRSQPATNRPLRIRCPGASN